ncbi:hypothetical protein P3T43_005667 [Paraburkholderia sp. GAS41]
MLSDITSDQSDSIQCRHCGSTLAARLLFCPSCGANQTHQASRADTLDPLSWFPPSSVSGKACFPPSPSLIAPQLAAPAAWNTPAGGEDDRFYAKYDPWNVPSRSRRMPVVVALLLVLLALAVAGYLVLRRGNEVRHVVPKAVFGSVTGQQAGQVAAVPAPPQAAVPVPVPTPRIAGPVAVNPSRSAPLMTKQAVPAVSTPKTVVPTPTPTPAATAQNSARPAIAPRSSAAQVAATHPPIASGTLVQHPVAQTPATPAARVAQVAVAPAPKPVANLAAAPRPAIAPVPEATRALMENQDMARTDVARNLQIAHAMLQRNNLSAAESRVAAVLVVQPNNRDALSMREDLSARHQQRDAALDVARGCEYMGRWTCAWQQAGNALVIDSGSAEAKRIVALAMHEAQLARAPSAAPVADSSHEPAPHH